MVDELRPKLIGAAVQRLEDPRLLTGHGSFVDDKYAPGLLQVALARSPHAHARITGIDTAAAAALPGVVAVVTAADLEGSVHPARATSRMKDYHATTLIPLARDVVRYVGEPVVAVVAESRYVAEDALERLDVAYDPLPDVTDPEAAAEPGAPLLHDDAGTNVLLARTFSRGDAAATVAAAPVRVSARFRFRRKTPVAIENRAYMAEYDQGRRSLTLHSTTQVPGIIRDALVDILDMPGSRIRVVAPDVGGGFGGKASLYPEEILVCALARRLGRPVKWTSDRLEDLSTTTQAFDEIVDAELALAEDGTFLALRADAIGDIGAYSIYPWTAVLEPVQVVSFLPGPYRIPDYAGRTRGVATSKAPMGPYRGVGRPISTFVTERLVDLAARKLGVDPIALRLKNLVTEFPYRAGSGLQWDQSTFVECLERARDALDYAGWRRRQAEARAAGRWLGIGIASYAELTGIGSRISAAPGMPINTGTETATVRIDMTGAITAQFGVASHGQGLETTLAQVVADVLGSRVEDVEVIHGDTAVSPRGTGTYASRSAVLAGGAGILAAQAVREKIIKVAAHLFEAAPEDVETGGGQVFIRGTDRTMSFRQLAKAVYAEIGRVPQELADDLEATKVYDPYFGTTSSAAHACVVEIDPETFKVSVLRYLVVEDCGRVINPPIVDGQVHGGVAQGIGAALYEEVIYDDSGQILTASLVDYLVPAAGEIPPIEVLHMETVSPSTLGGFRGMGEGGTIGAPAAIANAVSDALAPLGLEIDELPITPERLFRLVQSAKDKA